MCKKYLILLIPLITLIAISVFSANVYSVGLQGHYKDQGGPGANVEDCDVCHDFAGGYYNSPSQGNLRWVRSTINSRTVKFTLFSSTLPADGTLADGNDSKLDGPCEVCHTTTNYHTNTGDGKNHFDAQNCTGCHPHFRDDIINYFEPHFIGTQSHVTHWDDPKGPQLGRNNCTACHYPSDYSKFGPSGQPFATTTICDPCHSPGGSFNGVGDMDPGNPNSVAYGAKYNWENGIYTSTGILKEGKENWCAGCHDNGTSVIQGVAAPNVMGDNVTYGYNKSGHGRNPDSYIRCDDCHDVTMLHIDGNPRTYSAASNNYKDGYRLITGMTIPRFNQYGESAFRLCFDCHIYSEVFGSTSNFRDDNGGGFLHDVHAGQTFRNIVCWDSDWNSMTFPDKCATGSECAESAMSCTTCHNVHGSPMVISSTSYPSPKMIRRGELISTPGTTDKVPALDFHWYDANSVPTTDFNASRWGGLVSGEPERIDINHVCWGCHPRGENRYYRVPGGPETVKVNNVWTTNLANEGKVVFAPGESIRYHVSYTVNGPRTSYNLKSNGKAQNTTGTAWSTTLSVISRTAAAGTYEETWDKSIPSGASSGSNAKVTVTVKMRYAPSGTVISQGSKTATFRIQ